MQRRIFIFNPETDYALALGRKIYNPPASISRLRKDLQLTPVHLASPGDCILVTDDYSPELYPDKEHLRLLEEKEVLTLRLDKLKELSDPAATPGKTDLNIVPWGWNHTLRRQLTDAGAADFLLKTDVEIDTIRELSHRRTTIPFQRHMQSLLPNLEIPVAREFLSVDDALGFLSTEGDVYFKAPWSSAGRGVLHVATVGPQAAKEEKTRQWVSGFIRKQGSVTGERAFGRKADFATEWWLSDGEPLFLGLSLFETSDDGRYLGNRSLSQEEISLRLQRLSPQWSAEIPEAQKSALAAIIAPRYSGPVGIDMLISTEGCINPCVEINLRLTMGMVSLGKPLP